MYHVTVVTSMEFTGVSEKVIFCLELLFLRKKNCPRRNSFFDLISHILNFNLHPLFALKSPLGQNETCKLVKHYTIPDTDHTDIQRVAE